MEAKSRSVHLNSGPFALSSCTPYGTPHGSTMLAAAGCSVSQQSLRSAAQPHPADATLKFSLAVLSRLCRNPRSPHRD